MHRLISINWTSKLSKWINDKLGKIHLQLIQVNVPPTQFYTWSSSLSIKWWLLGICIALWDIQLKVGVLIFSSVFSKVFSTLHWGKSSKQSCSKFYISVIFQILHLSMPLTSWYPCKNLTAKILGYSAFVLASCAQ